MSCIALEISFLIKHYYMVGIYRISMGSSTPSTGRIRVLQQLKILSDRNAYLLSKHIRSKGSHVDLEELKTLAIDSNEMACTLKMLVDTGILRNQKRDTITFTVTEEAEKILDDIENGRDIF